MIKCVPSNYDLNVSLTLLKAIKQNLSKLQNDERLEVKVNGLTWYISPFIGLCGSAQLIHGQGDALTMTCRFMDYLFSNWPSKTDELFAAAYPCGDSKEYMYNANNRISQYNNPKRIELLDYLINTLTELLGAE